MKRLPLSALAVAACTVTVLGTATAVAATGLSDPIPAPIPNSQAAVGLQVVADGMVSPVEGKAAPGDKKRLYVIDQTGKIMAVDTRGRHAPTLVADLSGLVVSNLGKVIPTVPYDERGLLGIAFAPDFQRSHLVYTFETENVSGPADFTTLPAGTAPDSQSVVREWKVLGARGARPHFDMSTGRELLRIDKPEFNHNGGDLAFGPDGKLYISVGDGGAADDQGPGHVPGGNAQSLAPGNVLGKILRINPRGHNSANGHYGIPASNPFVGRAGADEIWAYGFRNPYRFSFDSRSGRLVAADVGQNDIEEVDVVRRGGNYGWPIKEGTFLFDNGGDGNGFVTANSPGAPRGLIDPIAEYDHTAPGGVRCGGGSPPSSCQGIAIVGGYVYRGHELDGLRGAYIAGDYSQGFAQPLGRLWVVRNGVLKSLRISGASSLGMAVFGFARDGNGELYVLGNKTGVVAGNTGQVVRLVESRSHH
jgi:glucose/arabinose dehydrogenase